MQTQAQQQAMQQAQQNALAQLQAARTLLDSVDGLIAQATLTLEEDGGYEWHEQHDVCSAVRDSIAELESYLRQYVN
jgi:hypothetical protein